MRKFFRKNYASLAALCFAMLFLCLWYLTEQEIKLGDLFVNLAACFFASALTIFFIDKIVDRHKQEDNLPMRMAMYRDVQLFTARFIGLWQEAYLKSVANVNVTPVKTMFSAEIIEQIFKTLDLETYPAVLPKQTWDVYFSVHSEDLISRGKEILRCYVNIISPDVLQVIHYLINDSSLLGRVATIIPKIRSYDIQANIYRIPLLQSYLPLPVAYDYKEIHKLLDWCSAEYEKLPLYKGDTNIYPIAMVVKNVNANTCGTCAITKEKIEEYKLKHCEYENRRKK